MKELQDCQRYIERDARPTCGPAHKNIDSKTGSVGTAVCHQYRLRSVKQGRPSHGGGSAGSYRDFRSNCPGSSPWRSSGSAATRRRGCCKIGRQVIPLSEAPAGVARWRLSRTKVNRGWTAVPFLAVRQARQVAATAPSAYGTCRSRQTRNQQVHKCSSPCSCQLTPGRVNSRETCARRLPAKNAAAFRKPVAVDKPHGTSDGPALGVNRDPTCSKWRSGMVFGFSREPCAIQAAPPERHFLKTKLSIDGRMRSSGYPFHSAYPNRLCGWFGPFDHRAIRCGRRAHGLLHQPEEEFAATFRPSTIEAKSEFVQVVRQMPRRYCALVRTQ